MTDTTAVLAAVRAGRIRPLPALLAPLDRAARRELLAGLKQLRAELGVSSPGWEGWAECMRTGRALLVAGAACQTGAAGAASWISGPDMRFEEPIPSRALMKVLKDRDARFLDDLAHRLAARSAAEWAFPLIRALSLRAGRAVPVTDSCVRAWAATVHAARGHLTDVLRADPHLAVFVPRLFETPVPVPSLVRNKSEGPHSWPQALAVLAEENRLDRTELIDACVARLLRGGSIPYLRPYRSLLEALRLTTAEERARVADWLALSADAPSPVAGQAQEALARLAASGGITAALLAQMSAAVFHRPEKKLVRAQLDLLGKVLVQDPDAAPTLLSAIGDVFGHPDTDIQQRALELTLAHLGDDETLRAGLADRVHLLAPVHHARAVAILGPGSTPAEEADAYEETLPSPQPRRLLSPPPESVDETVELVAAVVNSGSESVEEFERALDGLVRHAHHDRAALAAALRLALANRHWLDPALHHDGIRFSDLEHVAAAVLNIRMPRWTPGFHISECHHGDAFAAHHRRLVEVAHAITNSSLPFLLATPTHTDGALDPHTLVDRLAAYARLGVKPRAADLAQALLRVRRDRRDTSAAARAAALDTPEGARLAAWLGDAGRPAIITRRIAAPYHHHFSGAPVRHVLATGEQPVLLAEFPPAFAKLGEPREESERCMETGAAERLIALMPENRETLAAWSLPHITSCSLDDWQGGTAILPPLAVAGAHEPAGPALHLAVATGLGARHAEDRLQAVDALLILAGQAALDPVRLGADLAELLELGTIKATRLADALRAAAATGAHATIWTILAEVLPGLLSAAADLRGAALLLEAAAECAEQARVATEAPVGLDTVAARPGRSRLVTQAARLRDTLRQNRETRARPV
ncbi:DUF6493 family protein [Streptomyces sp. NPDC088729]|uniref:DUF7824 domain-containing protein n=1 Tax=Streptomyces sp. NPDC088729 TaxID=3365876 RepID=UPI0037F824C8